MIKYIRTIEKRLKKENLRPLKTIELLSAFSNDTLIEIVNTEYKRIEYARIGEIRLHGYIESAQLYLHLDVLAANLFIAQTSPTEFEAAVQIVVDC